MIDTKIVQEFGETFITLFFLNREYRTDIVDAEGIDLMCYKEESGLCYGVSVKTRNVQKDKPNKSINLKWNDIVCAYKETKLRNDNATLCYAFVISKANKKETEEIVVFICTQEFIFQEKSIENIEEYKKRYPNKEVSGATKSIAIDENAQKRWIELYKNHKEGVIFAGTYSVDKG